MDHLFLLADWIQNQNYQKTLLQILELRYVDVMAHYVLHLHSGNPFLILQILAGAAGAAPRPPFPPPPPSDPNSLQRKGSPLKSRAL
jgi:hypothetical protein